MCARGPNHTSGGSKRSSGLARKGVYKSVYGKGQGDRMGKKRRACTHGHAATGLGSVCAVPK
jgi:hypothetical protein